MGNEFVLDNKIFVVVGEYKYGSKLFSGSKQIVRGFLAKRRIVGIRKPLNKHKKIMALLVFVCGMATSQMLVVVFLLLLYIRN